MRVTPRGIALGVVVLAAFVLARAHGARSLGAVVVPGAVALGAGIWQVHSATTPELTRKPPADGSVGDREAVEVTVESSDAGQLLVREDLPAGIGAARVADTSGLPEWLERIGISAVPRGGTATIAALSGRTETYDIEFRERGAWTIGPTTVLVRDVFGLVEQAYELDETDTVLVYPRVRRLTPAARRRLLAIAGSHGGAERTVFDSLREYNPGDPLRDIHWRTSAKRDELIVAEYSEGGGGDRVWIVATTTPDCVDAMAEATASVVVALLEANVPVDLDLPGESLTLEPDDVRAVLAQLAQLSMNDSLRTATPRADADGTSAEPTAGGDTEPVSSPGTTGPADRRSRRAPGAHVWIDATPDGVAVTIGDARAQFETLQQDTDDGQPDQSDDAWVFDRQSRVERTADRGNPDWWMAP